MSEQVETDSQQQSASRDGLAALAALVLTVGLIIFVIASLV